MPFHLNVMTTFLNYFGTPKVLSSSDSTELPNIFTGGNPSFARRLQSAKLRSAKNAARLHQNRSIAGAATSSTDRQSSAAGTGTAAQTARKAREARYRVLDEEFWRRKAEQDIIERERRELRRRVERREQQRHERNERERLEQQRREEERRELQRHEREHLEHEAAQSDAITQALRLYLDKWAVLRFNPDEVEQLGFNNIPWPSFVPVQSAEGITDAHVRTFMSHLKHFQGIKKSANFAHQQLLCWHPDRFERPLFGKVIEHDREGVWKAVLDITSLLKKMR